MFRPRPSRRLLTLLSFSLLLLSLHPSVRAQINEPATSGFETEIRVWTSNGTTYAKVRLTFPNTGYSVSDWGEVVRTGNNFVADARVERYTGISGQMIVTKEHTYTLGALDAGTYSFTFRSYGTTLKSQQFDPSLVVEHWEATTLPPDHVGIRIVTATSTPFTKVELYLPDTGYSIRDWGPLTRNGNDFSVDIKLERFTGESQAKIIIAEQDYPLGTLAPGSYSLTVKLSGTTVRIQPFSITTAPAPKLLTEEGSERAIALDSVTWMRLFPLVTTYNFSLDQRARIMLLATNVELSEGESSSAVAAQAEDAQHKIYPLTVEYIGKVPNFDWLTQIIVKPPDELRTGGDVWISISVRGAWSNKALINIKTPAVNPP